MVLSKSTLLDGRYTIQGVLGEAGPLDITYMAWDVETEDEVVIREFFPVDLVRRAQDGFSIEVLDAHSFQFGLSTFEREAELLCEFRHSAVVEHTHVFRENGTVYRVSAHITGVSLNAYIQRKRRELAEEDVFKVMWPIIKGVVAAHQRHIYHGGLSPRSIMIADNGKPMLLNFQMARTQLAKRLQCETSILFPGFYPAEALGPEGFVAWDIFGGGALLYYVLVGKTLPGVTTKAGHHHIRAAVKQADLLPPALQRFLLDCLAYDPDERPHSFMQFARQFTKVLSVSFGTSSISRFPREAGYHYSAEAMYEPGEASHTADDYLFLNMDAPALQTRFPAKSEMEARPRSAHSEVPAHRATYLPEKKEPEIEDVLVKMVQRQQYVILASVLMILITGTLAGIFLVPRLLDGPSSAVLPQASAQVDASPQEVAGVSSLAVEQQPEPVKSTAVLESDSASALTASNASDGGLSTSIPTEQVDIREAEPQIDTPPSGEETNRVEREREVVPLVTPAQEEPDLEVAVDSVTPEPVERKAEEKEKNETAQQFGYLLSQGDVMYEQGQLQEALARYESALTLKPEEENLASRIDALRTELVELERKRMAAESLRVRLSKVTDESGVFIAPDTVPVLLNENELSSKVNYPAPAQRAGVEGHVVIRLVVDETGKVVRPQVVKGIGFGCDEEVLRVLADARFKPATFNKEDVKAWFMYSLVFSLD